MPDDPKPRRDGLTLLRNISTKDTDAGDLDTEERRSVIEVLDGPYAAKVIKPGGTYHTQWDMAALLKVSRTTIARDIKIIRRHRGHLVSQTDILDVAGELRRAKTIVQQSARDNEDMGLYWKVEVEYLHELQRLGIIREVPAELNLTGDVKVEHQHAFRSYTQEATADLLRIASGDRGSVRGSPLPVNQN